MPDFTLKPQYLSKAEPLVQTQLRARCTYICERSVNSTMAKM